MAYGKVRSGLVEIWLWKIYFSLLLVPGSASFPLCCAEESTKDETVLYAGLSIIYLFIFFNRAVPTCTLKVFYEVP